MIELNREIFDDSSEKESTIIDLDRWVKKERRLIRYENVTNSERILNHQELLLEILKRIKNEEIEMW